MSKRSKPKTSLGQRLFLLMSLFLVAIMVLGYVVTALPEPVTPTPTYIPTDTPRPRPTATSTPLPTATSVPLPSPTLEIGPVLPTATPTVTPTATIAPAAAQAVPATDTPQPPPLTFAVAGDSRHNTAQYQKLLAAVMASGAQFLINTGDLVDSGSDPQWKVFQKAMTAFKLPFYPVPGNHDGLNGKLDGYLQHSGAPAAHYSFDQGPIHLTFVDSHNGGVNAAELGWLGDDLAATSQPIKMVFLHHPPFDPDGTSHIMAFGNDAFMKLMVERRVQYVFAGHIHAYAQAERDGVLYTITGGGGAPLYPAGHPQAFYHFLLVTVQGEQVSIEVVKV